MTAQTPSAPPFHLLLAGPEEGEDLRLPLDSRALGLLPPVPPTPTPRGTLADDNADPNALAAQRWGLVLPEGQDLGPLLRELAPLLALRERQQRARVIHYSVPAGLEGDAVHRWCENTYEATDEFERPGYLLLLGGFEHLSLQLQQALSTRARVGRLSFDRLEDYGHYARKVCRWAETPGQREAEALLFSVRDGTSATRTGHEGLVEPCHEHLRVGQERGQLSLAGLRGPDDLGRTPKDFLDAMATTRPAVLLSMSHGMGAPQSGWSSADEQRGLQGAMRFGLGRKVSGMEVEARAFLPGGFWLYFACFGAGTPAVSPYRPWLEQLRDEALTGEDVDRLARTLDGPAPRPFTAALPQQALANPEGPLGVIAHVDLAWSYSFQELGGTRSRASRFSTLLMTLARGGRAGIAVRKLALEALSVEHLLLDQYDAMARGHQVDSVRLAHLWMLRQDLRSFVLLGDPAARLPLHPDT